MQYAPPPGRRPSPELPHDASDGRRHCPQGVITTVRSRRIDITLLADPKQAGVGLDLIDGSY
jgi:hypothetical protein